MTLKIPSKLRTCGCSAAMVTDHVLNSKGRRYKIGGMPRGACGRKEQDGPLVPGPWAYIYQLATVLDNHGGTGVESKRKYEIKEEHTVADGDVIEFDGVAYMIRVADTATEAFRHGDVYLVELCSTSLPRV